MYEDLRRVIGPKRTLEILRLLSKEGTLNYSDIESKIETSSDVISTGLNTLVAYDLVERTEESQRNVRYTVTDRGDDFLEKIGEIDTFLDQSR
jgi:DNA-binding HxlR family transcriptional regulator